ncbi:MAG: FTR1 family protein [Clostridia bacterium]|nr:FTR1 family protein [Clostridia bacterium]
MPRLPVRRSLIAVLLLTVLVCAWGLNGPAARAQSNGALASAEHEIAEAVGAIEQDRVDEAKDEYEKFKAAWPSLEDEVRAADPSAYAAIEDAMRDVDAAFASEPVDAEAAESALERLERAVEAYLDATGTPAKTGARLDAAGAYRVLEGALADAAAGDVNGAEQELDRFAAAWPYIEGGIKSKSPAAYDAIESQMTAAFAALRAGDARAAEAALERMEAALEPLAQGETTYTWWDAAIILLREGLEAILIVAALLAFVNRGPVAAQRNWIYGGAFAGVLASVALALGLSSLLSVAVAGHGAEFVEGVAGVVAVVMMLTVGAWLHRRSTLAAWQKYIREQVSGAVARGSMAWLAAMAFIAVLREGAETVIFLAGMAPSIGAGALYGGIAAGLAVLFAIGFAILKLGLKTPVRPFFLVATVLIYYLAVKFTGQSLHALQVAGVIPSHAPGWLPEIDWLGVYPSLETIVPQAALLVFVAWQFFATERRGRRAAGELQSPSPVTR